MVSPGNGLVVDPAITANVPVLLEIGKKADV
jgi:hypothetical protein